MRLPLLACLSLALSGCLVPGAARVGGVADPSLVLPGARSTPVPSTAEATAARRRAVARSLGSGLLLVASGPEVKGRFEADPDFWWLTGVNEPEAALLLVIDQGEVAQERLYLRSTSASEALWDGAGLGLGPGTVELTGIASVAARDSLGADLGVLLAGEPRVYAEGEASLALFGELSAEPASPRAALSRLQAVKEPAELAALQTAVDITLASLADAFVIARPGAWEFQAEAAIEAGFRRRGASFRAFPSICGSGPNGCVLHYRDNERQLGAGELLLMDVGARYGGYCADVTRTIPVSGEFTPRQRELYELVLATQRLCEAALRPGVTMRDVHQVAVRSFEDAGYREAFRHGVGHHLGLRTHDAPGFRGPLEPGMVVTLEPGLYLPDEGIGIRIEDDYLVTEDGARKLSGALPSDPDALEAYLARLRR